LITIKYSKVELLDTPLEFPFKVPAKLLKPWNTFSFYLRSFYPVHLLLSRTKKPH
jgi:hypothetical protein